jgi:hypothetical protein
VALYSRAPRRAATLAAPATSPLSPCPPPHEPNTQERLLQQLAAGGGGGGGGADVPITDTSETIYMSSLALLKMLKHGAPAMLARMQSAPSRAY